MHHSPLPWWSAVDAWWITDVNGNGVSYIHTHAKRDDHKLIVECVNLVGPHINDPQRMALFRAVANLDATGADMLHDWLHERGLA